MQNTCLVYILHQFCLIGWWAVCALKEISNQQTVGQICVMRSYSNLVCRSMANLPIFVMRMMIAVSGGGDDGDPC